MFRSASDFLCAGKNLKQKVESKAELPTMFQLNDQVRSLYLAEALPQWMGEKKEGGRERERTDYQTTRDFN